MGSQHSSDVPVHLRRPVSVLVGLGDVDARLILGIVHHGTRDDAIKVIAGQVQAEQAKRAPVRVEVPDVQLLLALTTVVVGVGAALAGTWAVAPGPQKVVLQEPNLLVLNELQLTVGERQKLEATDLVVAPKPEAFGLFGYDQPADQYTTLTRTGTSVTTGWFIPKDAPVATATSLMHFVHLLDLEEVAMARQLGVALSLESATVLPLVEKAPVTSLFGLQFAPGQGVPGQQVPTRWVPSTKGTQTLTFEALGAGLSRGEATLAPGPYCVYLGQLQQFTVLDHCFAFRVVESQDRAWVDNAPVAEGG